MAKKFDDGKMKNSLVLNRNPLTAKLIEFVRKQECINIGVESGIWSCTPRRLQNKVEIIIKFEINMDSINDL